MERPSRIDRIVRILAVVVAVLLFLFVLVVAGYFYVQYREAKKPIKSEDEKILTALNKVVQLPDEIPTIATVTNKEKLPDQTFFKQAEDGDKVFIFTQAQRAILYRPSSGKVIDIAPVRAEQVAPPTFIQQTPSTSEPVAEQVPITLYNGGTKLGVTSTVETVIEEKYPSASVIAKETAAKDNYQGTIVVDISGNNGALASGIAALLGGSVASVPAGEAAPSSGILVIIGNAYTP